MMASHRFLTLLFRTSGEDYSVQPERLIEQHRAWPSYLPSRGTDMLSALGIQWRGVVRAHERQILPTRNARRAKRVRLNLDRNRLTQFLVGRDPKLFGIYQIGFLRQRIQQGLSGDLGLLGCRAVFPL